MAALVVDNLPEGPAWLYELKFDGYRALRMKHEEDAQAHLRVSSARTSLGSRVPCAGDPLRWYRAAGRLDGPLGSITFAADCFPEVDKHTP